jgi:CRISPR-associated protein Cmr4
VFFFQVGIANPEYFRIKNSPIKITGEGIKKKVTAGLKQLEFLGIGGMNTRGMGRIRVYEAEKKNDKKTGLSNGAEPGKGGGK